MAEPPLNGVAETGHRGFSLCADGTKRIFFILSVGYIRALSSRGDHRSPAKNHKDTCPLLYFSMPTLTG